MLRSKYSLDFPAKSYFQISVMEPLKLAFLKMGLGIIKVTRIVLYLQALELIPPAILLYNRSCTYLMTIATLNQNTS